jgi:hypothetical protein
MGKGDATLEKEPSHLIDHRRATRNEASAQPVDRLQIQLLNRLEWHEPHGAFIVFESRSASAGVGG